MKALVTGAAGFIGSHLTGRLLSDGHSVVAVDCFAPTYDTSMRRDALEELRVRNHLQVIEGDLLEMELTEMISEVDAVFHLAARPGVRASWEDFDEFSRTNVQVTKRLLAALARAKHQPVFVFASSSSVYGNTSRYPTPEDTPLNPISPYGVTKAAAEHLVRAYVSQFGVKAVMLRYFTVYGPRQRPDMAFHRWIRAALTGDEILLYGDGSAVRDFTYVDDVVDATVQALDLETGSVANVAGGSPVILTDVVDEIALLAGRKLAIRYEGRQKGDPMRTGGDTSFLRSETSWRATTDLSQGLRDQFDWMKQILSV